MVLRHGQFDVDYQTQLTTAKFVNHLHTSILLTAFILTQVLLVWVIISHWYTHAESVYRCTTSACHCNARLIPFIIASSSARFIYCTSFIGQSQHAFSSIVPWFSKITLITRELASTHEFISSPAMYTSPWAGSSWCTLVSISTTICLRGASFSVIPFICFHACSSFYHSCGCMEPPTDRKISHQLSTEGNTVHCVSITSSRTEFSCFHCSVLCSLQSLSPSKMVSSLSWVGTLLDNPKDSNLLLTSSAESISLFMYMLLTYADVALFICLSFSNTVLMIIFIIRGATLRPNLNCIFPLMMTVWNGCSISWICIWRYAFRNSCSAMLAPCCHYSLIC